MVARQFRAGAPSFESARIEFAARLWILNDRASVAGPPAEVLNDDGGGGSPVALGVATTRELQAGVNYYFTPNVRLMGNLVLPFDARTDVGPGALMRWQFQF
jgi:hypothetical protein